MHLLFIFMSFVATFITLRREYPELNINDYFLSSRIFSGNSENLKYFIHNIIVNWYSYTFNSFCFFWNVTVEIISCNCKWVIRLSDNIFHLPRLNESMFFLNVNKNIRYCCWMEKLDMNFWDKFTSEIILLVMMNSDKFSKSVTFSVCLTKSNMIQDKTVST